MFFFLLSVLLLTGCSAYQYISSPQYIPLNKKKGELKLAISSNSYQIGYAFSDKFSVFHTGYDRAFIERSPFLGSLGKENMGNVNDKDGQSEFNLGASYFKKSEKFHYEVLAGVGYGKLHYQSENGFGYYSFDLKATKYNFFIQPDLCILLNENIELGAFAKLIFLDYFYHSNSGNGLYLSSWDKSFYGGKSSVFYFIEPGFIARFGSENVKFQTQVSPAFNITNFGDKSIDYRKFNLRFSLFLSLDLFKGDN